MIGLYAKQHFSSLEQEFGYSAPLIKRETFCTLIQYLGQRGLAVEIEIEHREVAVFLSIVRLKDGALPNPAEGPKYGLHRKYLDDVIHGKGRMLARAHHLSKKGQRKLRKNHAQADTFTEEELLKHFDSELKRLSDDLFSVISHSRFTPEGIFGDNLGLDTPND